MTDQLVPPDTRPRPRAKWIAGITMIVVGLGALAVWAITSPDAVAYYKTPSEVHAGAGIAGRNLRVGGRLAAGTFERHGRVVSFTLTDQHHEVPVVYRGEVPDTLKEDTDVIAEGALSDGTLHATRVLAKCSSKFVPVEDAKEQLGKT